MSLAVSLTRDANAQSKGIDSATVIDVVDADTLDVQMVDGRLERVRLIGIDSPNVADAGEPDGCYAVEAHDRASQLALGRQVELELDVQQRDDHGNLLAYVWLAGDLLNVRLVAEGAAWPSVKYPNMTHTREIFASYREAALLDEGWWSACEALR